MSPSTMIHKGIFLHFLLPGVLMGALPATTHPPHPFPFPSSLPLYPLPPPPPTSSTFSNVGVYLFKHSLHSLLNKCTSSLK